MRPGWRKPTGHQEISTGGQVTQNEPSGVIALAAHTEQILVQAQRQLVFATARMMCLLPIRNPEKLRGGTQLVPQLSGTGIGLAGFRCRVPFNSHQSRTQGAEKFEFPWLTLGAIGQL